MKKIFLFFFFFPFLASASITVSPIAGNTDSVVVEHTDAGADILIYTDSPCSNPFGSGDLRACNTISPSPFTIAYGYGDEFVSGAYTIIEDVGQTCWGSLNEADCLNEPGISYADFSVISKAQGWDIASTGAVVQTTSDTFKNSFIYFLRVITPYMVIITLIIGVVTFFIFFRT